jgi:hypothetical protein
LLLLKNYLHLFWKYSIELFSSLFTFPQIHIFNSFSIAYATTIPYSSHFQSWTSQRNIMHYLQIFSFTNKLSPFYTFSAAPIKSIQNPNQHHYKQINPSSYFKIPNDLYYTRPDHPGFPLVGTTVTQYNIPTNVALETCN